MLDAYCSRHGPLVIAEAREAPISLAMMQWLISAGLIVAAALLLPMQMRSMRRWQRGRTGGIVSSFATGLAAALDPAQAMIVQEMEKRQNQDGEEADGDDEPLEGARDEGLAATDHRPAT